MTLTELPQRITIGDTVTWDEALSEFPAGDSWVLIYSFTALGATFASTHSAVGDDHRITIDTTELEEGEYQYTKKVEDGSEVFTLASGTVKVKPDLSADTSGVDRRTFAAIALSNIEAMLKGKATKDQTSYSLNGRALSRYSVDDLQAWRAQLRSEVRDEEAQVRREAGGKSHRNVRLGMSSAIS